MASSSSLKNYTPHEVIVMDTNGTTPLDRFPPQETTIRLLGSDQKHIESIGPIRVVTRPTYTGLNYTPPEGESIIVSMVVAEYMVAQNMHQKYQIYVPDSSPKGAVRDEMGVIKGVRQLVKYF